MAQPQQEAELWGKLAVAVLEALGFIVNYNKSILTPVQAVQFLGFNLDSIRMTLTVPQEKLQGITAQAQHLLSQTEVTGRELAKFVGTASSMTLAITQAPLFYRALQTAKNATLWMEKGLDNSTPLGTPQREELQ